MGNSTITLQNIVDALASTSESPMANPGSYAVDTLLAIANDVMDDLISRRFNFKWNSALFPPFLTNSFQQDYPQVDLTDVGWLESAWCFDPNSLQRPIDPLPIEPERSLAVQGGRWCSRPAQIAWLYNAQMQLGTWPGAGVVYAPLRTQGPVAQNPVQSMLDPHGNILVLTQPGTTGTTLPDAGNAAAEGTTVTDGSCVWTLAAPNSQGFRIAPLPPGAGPVSEIHGAYQRRAVPFTDISQTLGPIPDDFAQQFRRGFRVTCNAYAPDEGSRNKYPAMRGEWLQSMEDAEKQGEREADSYMLVPATQIVAPLLGVRDPTNPARPY